MFRSNQVVSNRLCFRTFMIVSCCLLIILAFLNLRSHHKYVVLYARLPFQERKMTSRLLEDNKISIQSPEDHRMKIESAEDHRMKIESSKDHRIQIDSEDDLIFPALYNSEILIVNWRHLWDNPSEGLREGLVREGCRVTYNQSLISKAAAVVFEYTALDHETLPWKYHRHQDQVFVFRVAESTASMKNWFHFNFNKFGQLVVNWTMTYRRDSDVYAPYIKPWQLRHHVKDGQQAVDRILAKKSRKALWVVSNCDGSSGARRRMKLVKKLIAEGFEIDCFGGCFGNSDVYNSMSQDQIDSYKFYIAFENSFHCRDYITEKFWQKSLIRGRVPIVWGPSKSDVTQIAPRGSFIHVDDFKTPRDLAQFLIHLDADDVAYRSYFDWMIDYDVNKPRSYIEKFEDVEEHLLCEKLKNGFARKSITSLDRFWYGSEDTECFEE